MTIENIKNLMIMYGELYYQEQMIEGLGKIEKQPEEAPVIPPEVDQTVEVVVWGIFLALLMITVYQLFAGTFWFIVTGFLGCIALMAAISINDGVEKQIEARAGALKEKA